MSMGMPGGRAYEVVCIDAGITVACGGLEHRNEKGV
jgi:hypothetical protein